MSEHQSWEEADWWETQPPAGRASSYRVRLPVFEGPLDLLLHLIRKHELDIFDIPIALITEKYLAYLGWMQVLNLDIAGEFLVMAATLAHIKSRMLLPPEQAEGGDEEEAEEDPREELVRRLLDYQRYKEVAEQLRDQPILDRDVFCRVMRTPPEESNSPFAEVSIFRLIEALDRVLKRAGGQLSHDVMVDRVSVADRMLELADLLKQRPEAVFEELFEGMPTRGQIVATFLALLEMARLRMLRLHQAEGSELIHVQASFGEIELSEAISEIRGEID